MTGQPVAAAWQALRRSPAEPGSWLALAQDYAAAGLAWQAAYAARQAWRLDAALAGRLDALGIGPWRDAAAGDGLLGRADVPEAGARMREFAAQVARCPGDWLTWLYLARLAELPGADLQAGVPAPDMARIMAEGLEFLPGETLHWLGVWRLNAGDGPGAVKALSPLASLRPQRYGSMMYLGEALLRTGNVAAAEDAFARASASANPELLLALAARAYAHNYWQEAIAVLRKALELRPGSAKALLMLARIQSEAYALGDCRETLARLRSVAPDHAEARLIEAGLHGRLGDAATHLNMLQRLYAEGGDRLSRLASSIAMTALYQDSMAPAEVAALHRQLCAPIEAALPASSAFANDRTPGRTLKVGFVTGDLHRQHPVNIFMQPLLARFDRARMHVHVYHTGTMHDAETRQARSHAASWTEAAGLDDSALHRAIRSDGIDILVDLAGHTSTHRLGVFALRAAPVQATFLGYPHSTGLGRMDWLIGDPTVSPAAHAPLFSEAVAQLPNSVFCWAPVDTYPLPAPRPAQAPVVFGSFNNAMKLSPRTIALWSRVLRAVPAARLLLKAPSLGDREVRERYVRLFGQHGVAADRLDLRGPSGLADMMREYGDVDIALDPTPYNGGTTTLQALWMGVPVVALEGGNFVGRMGASFLRTLGRAEWVAADDDAYVAIAASLAGTAAGLRAGRVQLRAGMAASPLCDIATYCADFERLLRRMWGIWCAGERTALLAAAVP